jgi:hypothetical protein
MPASWKVRDHRQRNHGCAGRDASGPRNDRGEGRRPSIHLPTSPVCAFASLRLRVPAPAPTSEENAKPQSRKAAKTFWENTSVSPQRRYDARTFGGNSLCTMAGLIRSADL